MIHQEHSSLITSLGDPLSQLSSLKQLGTVLSANKASLFPSLTDLFSRLQPLLSTHKENLSTLATQFLTLIATHFNTPDVEKYFTMGIMNQAVLNLGNQTIPPLRQSSHLFLLKFVQTYKNFDNLLFHYIDVGLGENVDWHVQQKVINSFQSIFLLSNKLVNCKSSYLQQMLDIFIQKASHFNQVLSKASLQVLTTLCKSKGVREILNQSSNQTIQKLSKLIQSKKISGVEITRQQLQAIIEGRLHPELNPEQPLVQSPGQPQKVLDQDTIVSLPYSQLFSLFLDNEQNLTLRLQCYEVLKEQIREGPQTQLCEQLALHHVDIYKLLRHQSIKIVQAGVHMVTLFSEHVQPQHEQLKTMIRHVAQGLGDERALVRQMMLEAIQVFLSKGPRQQWVTGLLECLSTPNQHIKEEILSILNEIFKSQSNLPDVNFQQVLTRLSPLVEDPKTRIKLRTFQCLVEVCLSYNRVKQGTKVLQGLLSPVYYDIFLDRVGKPKKQSTVSTDALKLGGLKNTLKVRSKYQQARQKDIEEPSRMRSSLVMRYRKKSEESMVGRKSIDGLRKRIVNSIKQPRPLSQHLTSKVSGKQQGFPFLPSLQKQRSPKNLGSINIQSLKSSRGYSIKTSRSRLSMSKDGDFRSDAYLLKSDLKPMDSPKRQLKTVLMDLQDTEWKKQFEAINILRRITEHHSQLITESPSNMLSLLTGGLLKAIEGQRSALIKNGLLCLTQMINNFGRNLDTQAQLIVNKLTRKAADANIFINFQVRKCLNTAATMLTESKILQEIETLKGNKSIPLKDTLVEMLHSIVNKQVQPRDPSKLCDTLAYFLDEASNDLKNKARVALRDLCQKFPVLQNRLKTFLPSQGYTRLTSMKNTISPSADLVMERSSQPITRVNSTLMNPKSKWPKPPAKESPQKELRENNQIVFPQVKSLKRKAIKITSFPHEFQKFPEMFEGCKDSDWRKRIDYLKKTTSLAQSYPTQFSQYRLSSQYIDIMAQQIGQHNLKVSSNALQTLRDSLVSLRLVVENNLSIVTNSVFNSLSSSKSQSKTMAQEIFHLMITQIDLNLLLQHWCFGCLFSLPKSREYLLTKLMTLMTKIHETKTPLLVKHVIPMLDRLLEDKKPEIVYLTGQLTRQIYSCLGEQMFIHSGKKVQLGKYLKN